MERRKKLIHISTDEVYGDLEPDDPAFTEQTPLSPNEQSLFSKQGEFRPACKILYPHLPITRDDYTMQQQLRTVSA
ncbi:hypothetical protein BsIDN1_66400 [Bacillus safensis]|uniref:Uncharacterized protein n=1 Tax=Bacillus safensis TaxID=561879 RepID=A0A5S9MK22_BACIA|nr:hypothetical protein BsIDN1_66400 [Bacillus safensis]